MSENDVDKGAGELEDKLTGKESTEEMMERARRLLHRRVSNTHYHDKLPVPSQTPAPEDSKICKYWSILHNPEKGTTMKDHAHVEIEKYCSQCKGYSPIDANTGKAICPFYSEIKVSNTSEKDD